MESKSQASFPSTTCSGWDSWKENEKLAEASMHLPSPGTHVGLHTHPLTDSHRGGEQVDLTGPHFMDEDIGSEGICVLAKL